MPKRLERKPLQKRLTQPDRLRPFLNEWGMVEFAVRNVRVAPGDCLEMLVGEEWLSGRFTVYPNPDGPRIEVAGLQTYRIGEDSRLRARLDGPSAPLHLLTARPEFVHPRCAMRGIGFTLNGKLLRDQEPVEVDIEGKWQEGLLRLPLHHEQALLCDVAEQFPAFITCHTRVRHTR